MPPLQSGMTRERLQKFCGTRNISSHDLKQLVPADEFISQEHLGMNHQAQIETNFDGMLTNADRSSGADRSFDYDFRQMTTVIDEHGRVLVRNFHNDGRLSKQVYANGDVYTYAYDWAPGKSFANSA
jgi:hypothetical protein